MLLLDSLPREGTETLRKFLKSSHQRSYKIVGLFTPRGDGNRLAIGHKGAGRERVVGLFTPKRSRISTAAPSRNFYSTSDSCRTTVRRRPRGSCRGAPRIRGNDSRFHLSLLSAPMSIASECHMSIVGVIL